MKNEIFAIVCPTSGGEFLYNADDVYPEMSLADVELMVLQADLRHAGMETDGYIVMSCYRNHDGSHDTCSGEAMTLYEDC
jgi:hypothetical protein